MSQLSKNGSPTCISSHGTDNTHRPIQNSPCALIPKTLPSWRVPVLEPVEAEAKVDASSVPVDHSTHHPSEEDPGTWPEDLAGKGLVPSWLVREGTRMSCLSL